GYLSKYIIYNPESSPFTAQWKGKVKAENLYISFTGKVDITLGDKTYHFKNYGNEKEFALLSAMSSSLPITVQYEFNPLEKEREDVNYQMFLKTYQGVADKPVIKIYQKKNNKEITPVTNFSDKENTTVKFFIGWIQDLLTGVIVLLLFFTGREKIRVQIYFLFVLCAIFIMTYLQLNYKFNLLIIGSLFFIPEILFRFNEKVDLRLSFLEVNVLLFLNVFFLFHINSNIVENLLQGLGMLSNQVLYLAIGDDGLTYERLSRILLEGNFFWGGEDAYFSHPFFRYYRAIQHLIFGDGLNYLFFVDYFLLLSLSICLTLILLRKIQDGFIPYFYCFFFYLLLFGLASDKVFDGLQEPLALSCFLLAIIVWVKNFEQKLYFIPLFIGIASITRINYIPGLFCLLMFIFYCDFKRYKSMRKLILPLTIYGFILLLPLAHNLYFNNTFDLFVTSKSLTMNAQVGIFETSLENSSTVMKLSMERFIHQLNYFFVIDTPLNGGFAWLFHIAQILFCVTLVCKIKNKEYFDVAFLLIPFAFLLPHIVFSIDNYYPRHILAGYISLSLFLALIGSENSKKALFFQAILKK
ncbi:MAG: hypothetical protein HQK84_05255, partial [Nitrospinae bacterium]|nr:hypothetical protein [Nitrospinota bacterium]